MFEKVGKQEDFLLRKKETHTGGWIPRVSHPYTCRISRKTVHWTIMDDGEYEDEDTEEDDEEEYENEPSRKRKKN